MIAALRIEDGICAKMTVDGGVRAKSFKSFVEKRLLPVLKKGDVVCWDNINLHKNKQIVAAIESVGASVLPIPPYSPDLNPIEAAWSYVKDWIRKHFPDSVTELKTLMRRALDRIKSMSVIGWFKYCGYNL